MLLHGQPRLCQFPTFSRITLLLWLVGAVLLAAGWIASYQHSAGFFFQPFGRTLYVAYYRGEMYGGEHRHFAWDSPKIIGFGHDMLDVRADQYIFFAKGYRYYWRGFGFGVTASPTTLYFKFTMPFWFVALLYALAFGWTMRATWFQRKASLHVCPGCGYDLRASKTRCPECGAEIRMKEPAEIPTVPK